MTRGEREREPNLRALQHAQSIRDSDTVKALNQFRALADRGSAMAMVEIAFMYSKGIGVTADASEEEAWYKRAVEAGSLYAQYALAHIYFRMQRYSEAFAVCQAAVASGYAPAMYLVAFMHGHGVGTERNLEKERDLLSQAMQRGHIWARVRLGRVLLQGRWGRWQQLRGLFLFLGGTIRAMYLAARNPKDERLYGHNVLDRSSSSSTPTG